MCAMRSMSLPVIKKPERNSLLQNFILIIYIYLEYDTGYTLKSIGRVPITSKIVGVTPEQICVKAMSSFTVISILSNPTGKKPMATVEQYFFK